LGAGLVIDDLPYFAPLKDSLQNRMFPSPILNSGRIGLIMKRMGLGYVPPTEYPESRNSDFDRLTPFRLDLSKLEYRENWSQLAKLSAERLPSTTVIESEFLAERMPVLSIVVDPYDLYDNSLGIYSNPYQKGRNWERLSFVSYFDNGKLQFASGAGIRIHGGKSRAHPDKNFRISFREIYGQSGLKRSLLNGKEKGSLESIVVKKPIQYFKLTEALAYDISSKIGCITPMNTPVVVFLNGEEHGEGFSYLYEHLGRPFLETYFGHDEFIFLRTKEKESERRWPVEYREFLKWAHDGNIAMTMEEVEKWVSLDNFTYWWISQIYCANSDPYQGLAVLNTKDSDSRWFWVNWDMDHSIANLYEHDINIWEQEKILVELFDDWRVEDDPRAVLMRRLVDEDKDFVKYFENEVMTALNHKIERRFLSDKLAHYKGIAKRFKIEDVRYLERTEQFLDNRNLHMFRLMKKYFGAPDFFTLDVETSKKCDFEIDGYITDSSYTGRYFEGTEVFIEILGNKRASFWLVNGTKVAGGDGIHVCIDTNVTIEPIFD
jgi:hypothetical protein